MFGPIGDLMFGPIGKHNGRSPRYCKVCALSSLHPEWCLSSELSSSELLDFPVPQLFGIICATAYEIGCVVCGVSLAAKKDNLRVSAESLRAHMNKKHATHIPRTPTWEQYATALTTARLRCALLVCNSPDPAAALESITTPLTTQMAGSYCKGGSVCSGCCRVFKT